MPDIAYCEYMPIFEVLPVLKARFFVGEFKPLFSAAAAYVKDDGFYFDLVKFEREPFVSENGTFSDGDSFSAVSFDFSSAGTGPVLSVAANANGDAALRLDGAEYAAKPSVFSYGGADERGWYRGVRLGIGLALLEKIYGKTAFAPGSVISGNVFTVQKRGERAHFGAVAPFAEQDISDKRNLRGFAVTGFPQAHKKEVTI